MWTKSQIADARLSFVSWLNLQNPDQKIHCSLDNFSQGLLIQNSIILANDSLIFSVSTWQNDSFLFWKKRHILKKDNLKLQNQLGQSSKQWIINFSMIPKLSLSLWLSPDKRVLIELFYGSARGHLKWKSWDGKLFVYNKLMTFIKLSLKYTSIEAIKDFQKFPAGQLNCCIDFGLKIGRIL